MEVSINGCTRKWMLYKGKSHENGWFRVPLFLGNLHMEKSTARSRTGLWADNLRPRARWWQRLKWPEIERKLWKMGWQQDLFVNFISIYGSLREIYCLITVENSGFMMMYVNCSWNSPAKMFMGSGYTGMQNKFQSISALSWPWLPFWFELHAYES